MGSLTDRARQLPEPSPGGLACRLGADVDRLPEPLRSEAIELILDVSIPVAKVLEILAEPDVGIVTVKERVTRHRRAGECAWCRRNKVLM